MLKNGLKNLKADIFPKSSNNFVFELDSNKKIEIDEDHFFKILNSNDEDSKKFLIALIVNLGGNSVVDIVRKNMIRDLKNKIEFSKKLKAQTSLESLFEDLEVPIYFEPETVIVKYTDKIIQGAISQKKNSNSNFSKIRKEIYEKYILKIFDYTVIFDEIYSTILNYDLENVNSAKVLRALHFILTMDYALKKIEAKKIENAGKSYYEIIREVLVENVSRTRKDYYFINLNYTNFLEKVISKNARINYIHGKVGEFMDLYDRRIITEDEMKEKIYDKKIIPNFVPQSLLKPIISVEMIERYYNAYKELKDAKNCIIVGYGLN